MLRDDCAGTEVQYNFESTVSSFLAHDNNKYSVGRRCEQAKFACRHTLHAQSILCQG